MNSFFTANTDTGHKDQIPWHHQSKTSETEKALGQKTNLTLEGAKINNPMMQAIVTLH